jgi:hypothetical protein
MKLGERKMFLGFTLVGTQVEQLLDYAPAIRIEAQGTALHTTTWGEPIVKLWCIFHFWLA